MSSSSDEFTNCNEISSFVVDSIPTKKRKLLRACDVCRRRKIRCDGAETVENSCSNCAKHDLVCAYGGGPKQLVPTKGYVEELEQKAIELQTLLQKLLPQVDLSSDEVLNELPEWNTSTIYSLAQLKIQHSIEQMDEQTNSDTTHADVSEVLNEPNRFWGKSSSFTLVKEAMELKSSQVEPGSPSPSPPHVRRREFWEPQPWETWFGTESPRPRFVFPEQDLLVSLVDLFFEHINLFTPLLHRPTFEKGLQSGLHYRDSGFATVVLLVCATASRHSTDPRVLAGPSTATRSCGWKWYNQVELLSSSLMTPATLYDLQAYCLALEFFRGNAAPQNCWTLVGIAIRLAQDVGAHRSKTFGSKPRSVEAELWKRAWWILVMNDRDTSAAAGRPCITHDEFHDVALPTECDDEFWDHPDPEKAWKQPPGVPCKVAYFNSYMKQNQILAHILYLLYCIGKPKHMYGVPDPEEWEPKIVAELDSSLNRWVDTIPQHLRWNPEQRNRDWRRQSISLYAQYYFLQIWIHRQFISSGSPSDLKHVNVSYPSLAICTNAARACCHLITPEEDKHLTIVFRIQWFLFSSAVVLLLNVFAGRKAGIEPHTSKDMQDVYKAMEMIKRNEDRFQSSGKLWDVLWELGSAGDLPLPSSTVPSNSRSVNMKPAPAPLQPGGATAGYPPPPEPSTPPFAQHSPSSSASDSPASAHRAPQQSSYAGHAQPVASLPLAADELAKLPMYSWTPAVSSNVPSRGVVEHRPNPAVSSNAPLRGVEHKPNHWTSTREITTIPAGAPVARTHGIRHIPHPHSYGPSPAQANITYSHQPVSYRHVSPSLSVSSFDSPRSTSSSLTHALEYPGEHGRSQQPQSQHRTSERHSQLQTHLPQRQEPPTANALDADTMQMWTTAPLGLEWSDWGTYLSNVSDIQMSNNIDNLNIHTSNGYHSQTY